MIGLLRVRRARHCCFQQLHTHRVETCCGLLPKVFPFTLALARCNEYIYISTISMFLLFLFSRMARPSKAFTCTVAKLYNSFACCHHYKQQTTKKELYKYNLSLSYIRFRKTKGTPEGLPIFLEIDVHTVEYRRSTIR